MRRFASLRVTSWMASLSTGEAANGLAAATLVNGANRAPIAAAYAPRLIPSRARRAFSSSAYWLGASVSPCAARCREPSPASP